MWQLHLHRLEDQEHVALLDSRPGLDADLEDGGRASAPRASRCSVAPDGAIANEREAGGHAVVDDPDRIPVAVDLEAARVPSALLEADAVAVQCGVAGAHVPASGLGGAR